MSDLQVNVNLKNPGCMSSQWGDKMAERVLALNASSEPLTVILPGKKVPLERKPSSFLEPSSEVVADDQAPFNGHFAHALGGVTLTHDGLVEFGENFDPPLDVRYVTARIGAIPDEILGVIEKHLDVVPQTFVAATFTPKAG